LKNLKEIESWIEKLEKWIDEKYIIGDILRVQEMTVELKRTKS